MKIVLSIVLFASLIMLSFVCTDSEPESRSEPVRSHVITLDVQGMHCTGCEKSIVSTLIEVKGVVEATADHETGSARVRVETDLVNEKEILQALANIGYTASKKKS